MDRREVSSTAILTNEIRASHQTTASEPKILTDPVAIEFSKQFAGSSALTAFRMLPQSLLTVIESALVLRSRYSEDVLEEISSQGDCQYVILGAGFDTFAYRQPAWAMEIPIFEIDHPTTQEAKREIIEEAGYTLPANLNFCPIDFGTTSLHDALSETSFSFEVPSVFSWLGVTQYVTDDAIRSTLEFVLTLPASTTIVLSFIPPGSILSEEDRKHIETFEKPAAARGEPFVSRFEPEDLQSLIRGMGFSDVYHLTPSAAQELYFLLRDDGLRAPELEQLIKATV
jgi:methyltransferase (TIGR00027 family)